MNEFKNRYDAETLYNTYTNIIEPRLNDIDNMLSEGKSFTEISNELGISNSLLHAIRQSKSFPRLRALFKIGANMISNVEYSLYRKAIGFYVEEEQAIKVKTTYTNKAGKKGTSEDVKVVKVMKYIEPDTQAIKFFLVNKDGDNYHAESQKPVDNSVDNMIEQASEILIKVRETAERTIDDNEQ